jgi:hypothetical protein
MWGHCPHQFTKEEEEEEESQCQQTCLPSLPRLTPQNANKGKRKASNSNNINPRSHSTPASKNNNVFAHYEEYALKRDAGKVSSVAIPCDIILLLIHKFHGFREGSGGSGKPWLQDQ